MELQSIELTPEEKMVFDFIKEHGKVTQLDIARGCPSLGSHKIHEGYEVKQSTLRKVRSLIRGLVMKHGLFILSDNKGYFLKETQEQADEYMVKFERQARSSAKSYMQRYHVMQKMFGFKSRYFEQQMDLFQNEFE